MCGFGCYCFSGIRCYHQPSCGGGCGCSAVAVQFLPWPAAHAKCLLSHSPPAGRIAASPPYISGPPQFTGAPLSSANDVSLAHVVMTFYVDPSLKKTPCFIIHKGNLFLQLLHFLYDFYLWLANSDD